MREFVAGDRVIANFLSLNNGEAKYNSVPCVVISKGGYVYSVLVYTSSTLVLETGSVAGRVTPNEGLSTRTKSQEMRSWLRSVVPMLRSYLVWLISPNN